MRVPLMKHAFLNEEETKQRLADFIIHADFFSMGEKCREFEQRFAEYQQCRHAVLFNSGGSANLALLQSLKNLGRLRDGARVGYSALTWSTNVMPIIQLGMVPVPIDVDPATVNVMSHTLEERLAETPLDAFFATNVLGYCGDLDKIRRLCDERGIVFIEDNCEGLGGKMAGQHYGNFGLASTFSFFVAHHMSTIEGGMVCTGDDELYRMLKIVRANGWDRNVTPEEQRAMRAPYDINPFYAKYSFYELAYNFRPTDITGFLGLSQIGLLEENIERRLANHEAFDNAIRQNPDLVHIEHGHIERISPFGLIVMCRTPELRDRYLQRFIDSDIEVRPVIAGNMQNQPFYSRFVSQRYTLAGTDQVSRNGFYCGNYPDMTDEEVCMIINCLK